MYENQLSKSLNSFPGMKGEMSRLEQLFIGNKFDPQDQLKPQDELLAIPVKKTKNHENESKLPHYNAHGVYK